MLQILKAYGIPTRLVDAISKTYEETRANVSSLEGETELFKITTGVLQGVHTSPLLVHNSSGLCTTRGYRGSPGESWANNQA